MLDHPWLNMPNNYDYKMSDIEYKKYKLRQTFEGINHDFVSGERTAKTAKRQADYQEYCPGEREFDCNVSELDEDDADINGGDLEDNVTLLDESFSSDLKLEAKSSSDSSES